MKKKQTVLAGLLTILLLLGLLTGCGSSAPMAQDMAVEESAPMEAPMADVMAGGVTEKYAFVTNQSTADTEDGMAVEPVQTYAEKIIYTGQVYLETREFDEAVASLDKAVKEFGGFVQDSSVNGHTRNYDDGTTEVVNRWGIYTVRIPVEKFDAFMSLAGELGNVTSSSRSAENVTSQYTDHEARLSSLNIQEERLLAMLEESGDLESLIQLEARLSEVRYEIESIERSLRDLDQRLAYSTVTVELQEVEVYTPTATTRRSFAQKISDAFRDGWSNFSRGFQNFSVSLVYSLPTLILLAVIAVVAVICGKRYVRKRKNKKSGDNDPQ